jgi:hypothetical protein
VSKIGRDLPTERVYKSLWHLAIVGVGIYEFRHHKSKLSKVLSAGMMLFHLDATLADAFDTKPLSRRILERATGTKDADSETEPTRSPENPRG